MAEEKRLVEIYRSLPPYVRAMLLTFAETCWRHRRRWANVVPFLKR